MIINPWDGSASFAESCALIAHIKLRRGDVLAAQEIADELKATTNVIGAWIAAIVIEDAIAAHHQNSLIGSSQSAA